MDKNHPNPPLMASTEVRLAVGTLAVLAWRWFVARRRRATLAVDCLASLESFEEEEVLIEGEVSIVLGRFTWQPAHEQALVKLTARPVTLTAGVLRGLSTSVSSYSGAEYCYYDGVIDLLRLATCAGLRPAFALEVIAPASAKQVARARPQPGTLITETAATYGAVTLPYIEGLDPKSVSWVYNLLELKKERERMLFNDSDADRGFLLNVDTKWKSHPDCHAADADARAGGAWRAHEAVRDLYCLAICHRWVAHPPEAHAPTAGVPTANRLRL